MSTLLKVLTLLTLAVGIFTAIIFGLMLLNHTVPQSQRVWFVLIMLGAFPAAYLLNRLQKRL